MLEAYSLNLVCVGSQNMYHVWEKLCWDKIHSLEENNKRFFMKDNTSLIILGELIRIVADES